MAHSTDTASGRQSPPLLPALADEHLKATRRWFLRALLSGCAAPGLLPELQADDQKDALAAAIEKELGFYLTKSEDFRNVERHKPLPYKLPREDRLRHGLERETWQLEVTADPESDSRLRSPLSKADGTALDFAALMKIAETRAVRYLKVMTCNNLADPLGMGLWEGVPLREVIWLAKPENNVRRLYYRGYHNDDPKQIFQSSLPIGRVLEDPPGEQPVILCYKMNGQPLTGERGGPVRMIVPNAYGFKSVKWIREIFLTNNHHNNDTYAKANNDVDSAMKSYARFIPWPKDGREFKAGDPLAITGVAQSGMSGLTKVQTWLKPKDDPLPGDGPYFATAPWRDAEILPPPPPDGPWGERLEKLPPGTARFDSNGVPLDWPLRNSIAHWASLLPAVAAGEYELRCRTVDRNGIAQPMPRPFKKSGGNAIQSVTLTVG
jgi:DMSO/TMAO reductase YedYZ molybdopterin-dependent catalytic subunit